MIRVLSRPRMIALTLACILGIAVMVNLARWQWQRHPERQDFNATLTARFDESPRPLEELLASGMPLEDLQWLPVVAAGTYMPDESLIVVNVSQFGQAGFDPVTPLRLADSRIVLVNRGFLPLSATNPAAPSGDVTVVGRVRLSAERRTGAVTDPSEGELREVQRIDIERIARQLDGEVVPVYLELLTSEPPDSPALSRIAEPEFTLGPHLSYMVQWIVFSIFVVIGWVFVLRRELRRTSAKE
ncbi:MAG: SURF1 family protein [Ilumatobacteraceae bacterium]